MRVVGGNAASQIGKNAKSGRARASSGGFVLPQETSNTAPSQQSVQSSAVQDVSSLLALQGVEDSLQGKRRKAVRRGGRILDLLEDVRLGLLTGTLSLTVLNQLERLTSDHESSGDERVDALLSEIGLRAQVEVAKLAALQGRSA